MKHAIQQIRGYGGLMFGTYSLGNVKLADHYLEKITKIRVDSEALDDQKAGCYMQGWFGAIWIKLARWEPENIRDFFSKLFSMEKMP